MKNYVLPIGFKYNDQDIVELPIADTGAEAEKIYAKKPTATTLYSWFAKIIAISVDSIADHPIAEVYKKETDTNKFPDIVKKIPLVDAGSLLIQIQRECWEAVLADQRIVCVNCGATHEATIDLNRIEIPGSDNPNREASQDFVIDLGRAYQTVCDIEQMKEFEGMKFNKLRFRTSTLEDGIKHEKVSNDKLLFWENIAFATLIGAFYEEDGEETQELPTAYLTRRGKQLFTKDMHSTSLRKIRAGMQSKQDSSKAYYEEECPTCNKNTPFLASSGSFFQV